MCLWGSLKCRASARQVAHPAGDLETLGYVSHRPAKADTLDITLVKNLERDHAVTLTKTRRRESLARRKAHPKQNVDPGLTYKSKQDRSSPPAHQSDRSKRSTGRCSLEQSRPRPFPLHYNP